MVNTKLLLGLVFMVLVLPSTFATTLFQDDFEDGLDTADWDIGSYVSEVDGYMRMSGGTTWGSTQGAKTDNNWDVSSYSVLTLELLNVSGTDAATGNQGMLGFTDTSTSYHYDISHIVIYRSSSGGWSTFINGASDFSVVETLPEFKDYKIQYFDTNSTTKIWDRESGTSTWNLRDTTTATIASGVNDWHIGIMHKTGTWRVGEIILCDTTNCETESTPSPSQPFFEVTAKDIDTSATLYNITVAVDSSEPYSSNTTEIQFINHESYQETTYQYVEICSMNINYVCAIDTNGNIQQDLNLCNARVDENIQGYITGQCNSLTFDGIYTNVTNAIVVTPINDSQLYNFTVSVDNYFTQTFTNYNTTNDLQVNLTGLPLEDFTLLTPQGNTTRNPTYNITWTQAVSPPEYTVTYNVSIYNSSWSLITWYNTTSLLYYEWNQSTLPMGLYRVMVNASEPYGNVSYQYNSTLYIKPVNDYFRFYGRNYLDTEYLDNILATDSYTSTTLTGNPFVLDIYLLLNDTPYKHNQTFTINASDLTYSHDDYSESVYVDRFNVTINATFEPYELTFEFYQNGNPYTAEGVIHDLSDVNSTFGFENTSFVILQQELSEGYIKAKFGMTDGVNWTQFYEYINDYQTTVDEDIELLQNSDWLAYIKVVSQSNAPIKDAVIRAQYAYTEIGNWTSYLLLGQRLTGDDGYTFFVADSKTMVRFTVSKEGYDPVDFIISIGDESFTKDNPIYVYLEKDTSNVYQQAWDYIRTTFTDRTADIYGTIVAKGRNRVQVQTDYRANLALPAKDITTYCNAFDECPYNLVSGTDFNTVGTSDINVTYYLDNVYWKSVLIRYDNNTKTEIFNLNSLNSTYLTSLLVIMIILVTLFVGLLFKNTQIGVATFYATTILAGIIVPTFFWLTTIITLLFVIKIIRTVVSE